MSLANSHGKILLSNISACIFFGGGVLYLPKVATEQR